MPPAPVLTPCNGQFRSIPVHLFASTWVEASGCFDSPWAGRREEGAPGRGELCGAKFGVLVVGRAPWAESEEKMLGLHKKLVALGAGKWAISFSSATVTSWGPTAKELKTSETHPDGNSGSFRGGDRPWGWGASKAPALLFPREPRAVKCIPYLWALSVF